MLFFTCDDPNCKVCAKDASLPGPVFTSKSDWTNSAEKASADFMVKLCNSSYVNMDGLYITGYTGAGIWPDGSDHINITNMNIWDIDDPADTAYGTEGILVTGTTDSTFKNLNIWDIGQSRRSQGDHVHCHSNRGGTRSRCGRKTRTDGICRVFDFL